MINFDGEFIDDLCQNRMNHDDILGEVVYWRTIRPIKSTDHILSMIETRNLMLGLERYTMFFECDCLTNGMFFVLHNMKARNMFISEEFIEAHYEDCTNITMLALMYSHTVSEHVKVYLKMKWIDKLL